MKTQLLAGMACLFALAVSTPPPASALTLPNPGAYVPCHFGALGGCRSTGGAFNATQATGGTFSGNAKQARPSASIVTTSVTGPSTQPGQPGSTVAAVPLPMAGWLLLAAVTGAGVAFGRRTRG